MAAYELSCTHPDCGESYSGDEGFRLSCDREAEGRHGPAFLRAVYRTRQLRVRSELPGVFRFFDWLPSGPYYLDPGGSELGSPFCYRSFGVARRLGLRNLYIAFSGYWPNRGPDLLTRTFKEFEAQATMARFLGTFGKGGAAPLIISSAGNTANGFNLICHKARLPLYLVVPEVGVDRLLLPFETASTLIAVRGDYSDAINLADDIAAKTGLMREGGARNVARRAGMGAVMLNAVAHPEQGSGFLFDHYFQAVGSGTGAIAAWEAVQLLLRDGRFGDKATRIHVAQNSPFTPIVDSWEQGSREPLPLAEDQAKAAIAALTAPVLSNRNPPYSIAGGLYDVLKQSDGCAWRVPNNRLFQGARFFREKESVDIGPAAAVAVDALRQAVECGAVAADDRILLHITGGGREIQYLEGRVCPKLPDLCVDPGDLRRCLDFIGEPAVMPASEGILKRYE